MRPLWRDPILRAWIPADEDEAPFSEIQQELWDQSSSSAWAPRKLTSETVASSPWKTPNR